MVWATIGLSWCHLLFELNNPNCLSPSSRKRHSNPLIIFVILLWTHSNTQLTLCLSCIRGPRAGHRTPQVQSHKSTAEERRRITPLDLLAVLLFIWWNWFSGVQVHIARWCLTFYLPRSPSLHPQGSSQIHSSSSLYWSWRLLPLSCKTRCTWPCWPSWVFHSLTSQVCQSASGWCPFPQSLHLH